MPPPTIYGGLVGYWKFDGLVNSLVPDGSNHTDCGGALTNASLVSGGKFGNAFRASTSAGKMTVPDHEDQRHSATTRYSINVWLNLDKAINTMWGTPVFFDKTGGGTYGLFLGVLAGGGNVISFRVHNAAGTAYTVGYTESATSGWIMVTGVYEGGVVRIYRNAVSQSAAVADGTIRFGTSIIDRIGEGFEGLLDELSLWNVQLSGSDVTTLYASGTGLALLLPDTRSHVNQPLAYHDLIQGLGEVVISAAVPVLDLAQVALLPLMEMGGVTAFPYIDAPYAIVDSPKRIFVDPNPLILSVSINEDLEVTAVGNAGPTDAANVTTWWQIAVDPTTDVSLAEADNGALFQINRNQIDNWSVPLGQDWNGLYLTFWMRANEDSSQFWSSPPYLLSGDGWNNNRGFQPKPLPPGPALGPTSGPVIGPPGAGLVRKRTFDFSTRR